MSWLTSRDGPLLPSITCQENKSPTAPKWWTLYARTNGKWPTPATTAMVTHHLHPPRAVPTAPNSTKLAEQTVQHMILIVPNATKWDIGDQNASDGKPLQPRNAPPPGSQQRKSRCPPRNHNNHRGQEQQDRHHRCQMRTTTLKMR